MKKPVTRLLKTSVRLPSTIFATQVRFQLWLLIGDRCIEVGPTMTNHEDAQAMVTVLRRAFPDLDYEEWNQS